MGQKIEVELGATLCTNPKAEGGTHNYLKIGVKSGEIDLDGDVEEQARASLTASVVVFKILDEGLHEVIMDFLLSDEGDVEGVSKGLVQMRYKVDKLDAFMKDKMPKILAKIKDHDDLLAKKVKKSGTAKDERSPKAGDRKANNEKSS